MTIPSYYHSRLQLSATLWFAVSFVAMLVYALLNPLPEWDMVAYAASAESLSTSDPHKIHAKVYGELEDRLNAEEFEFITAGNHYRKVMYRDVGAFNEQLPFYSIRITFSALLAQLNKFGVNLYDAGYWVTALAFMFSLLVLWGGLNDRIHPLLQIFLPLAFYKYTMDLVVVRQIFVDSLAAVWVVFICISYLRNSKLLLPLIAMSVLVRVDLIIFSGLMLLLLFITDRKRNLYAQLMCGAVLCGLFLLIQHWAGSYGWKTLFYFAIISDMVATHPSVYSEIGFTFKEYLNSLFFNPDWISKMYGVSAILSAMVMLAWKFLPVDMFNRRVCGICLVCSLYIIIHYLIFPRLFMRFFVMQNMMIFSGFCILCTHYFTAWQKTRSTKEFAKISE